LENKHNEEMSYHIYIKYIIQRNALSK
jgi:hypothetical protein